MRLLRIRRRAVTVGALGVVVLVFGSIAGPGPAAADPTPPPEITDAAVFADPSSTDVTLTRGSSSVTLSRTANLTRQRITVSWSGMTPTQNDPTQNARNPLMIMQCRGDNPSREDCWAGGFQTGDDPGGGALKTQLASAYLPAETSTWWTSAPSASGQQMGIPFKKADGSYLANQKPDGTWNVFGLNWTGDPIVPVKPVDDWTPGSANYRFGRTGADGTGQIETWANTQVENPSLGCGATGPCSIVVVPVQALPCNPDLTDAAAARCAALAKSAAGRFPDWQLLGNWYQRFVFKLSFSASASVCDQRTDSAELIGSELVAEAMRRWVPERCQKSSPAGLDYTRNWEPDSRRQVGQPDPVAASGFAADGAVVSEPAAADDPATTNRKPAYAPVAVSGFAVGFSWDRNESVGGDPVTSLKLNARLVAKLLTQSYPGRFSVAGKTWAVNPNAPTNPQNILNDPELLQLNPDAANWAGKSGGDGTQMAIPVFNTDVMLALTRWIWSDPTARAFLQGKPDPWGMTVNTAYRGWLLPRDDYELRDGWTPTTADAGSFEGFSPQQALAQTSNSWSQAADVAMTAWPLSQHPAGLDSSDPNSPRVLKRDPAQRFGFHNVIVLSTTSELQKSGIPMASLQNSAGEYVSPDVESMTYALDGAAVDKTSGTWKVNYGAMDKRGYPGTMISYAMVPTSTLKGDEARRYADTIRWMSTDAQQYGPNAGQLPDGYLALTDPMREQAAKVADAVENQTGTPPIPDKDPVPDKPNPSGSTSSDGPNDGGQNNGTGNNGNGSGNGNDDGTSSTTNPTGAPSGGPVTPGANPSTGPSSNKPLAQDSIKPVSATTQGDSLGWLAWGIPAFLIAGLAAGVASPGIRLIATPGHPVRRGVAAGAGYLAGLFRKGRRRSNS